MITLFLFDQFPEDWEPSRLWFIAAMEGLIVDAPLLGLMFAGLR